MKLDLEIYLWDRIREEGDSDGLFPRDVIKQMLAAGMINNAKQAWRTLDKWGSKGWYGFGVSSDLGWKNKGVLGPGRARPKILPCPDCGYTPNTTMMSKHPHLDLIYKCQCGREVRGEYRHGTTWQLVEQWNRLVSTAPTAD